MKTTHSFSLVTCSVADPGCLSQIPDPDFYPSRISDPTTAIKGGGGGWGRLCCSTLFRSHKFQNRIENYFIFKTDTEKQFEPIDKEL